MKLSCELFRSFCATKQFSKMVNYTTIKTRSIRKKLKLDREFRNKQVTKRLVEKMYLVFKQSKF